MPKASAFGGKGHFRQVPDTGGVAELLTKFNVWHKMLNYKAFIEINAHI